MGITQTEWAARSNNTFTLKFNNAITLMVFNKLLSLSYGVPLRSKYPDSEMLFQKQKISRDAQNMMPKIIT